MHNPTLKYFAIITLIAVSNLLLILFLKYNQNGLAFKEFSLFKIGNLINITITLLVIVGSFLHIKNSACLKNLLIVSIIYFIPIIIVFFLKFSHFHYTENYLLGYPYRKIIPLIFLLVNQVLQLYIIVFAFLFYFNGTKASYFISFLYVVMLIIILVGISFYSTFNINTNRFNKNKPYDIGIVFGAAVWSGNKPSPIFRGRIEKGFKLFEKGIIKKIQLTGGNAPGEVSEARAAIEYLKRNKHINTRNILIEEKTTTTNEQIKYIKENFGRKKKILFISDNFHLKRILEMANFFNLDAVGVASDYKLTWKKSLFYRFRDCIGLLLFWIFGI